MTNHATQTIYGLISDSGDGSASIRWFRNKDDIDFMLDEENGLEQFWAANEGGAAEILTFPTELDLSKCGFTFDDIKDYE